MERAAWKHIYYRVEVRRPQVRGSVTAWGGGGVGRGREVPEQGDMHAAAADSRCNYPPVKVRSLSRVRLFVTPWTAAHQASPSMGFSRQEYWSISSKNTPGDLPHPGIEPGSPALKADALPSEPPGKSHPPTTFFKYNCLKK